MAETIAFYRDRLQFNVFFHDENYGVVGRDQIQIHFWKCDDRIHPENTSCYVHVSGVDALYEEMQQVGVVHPNGALGDRPWGMREFAITDIHGNLIKFGESIPAPDKSEG